MFAEWNKTTTASRKNRSRVLCGRCGCGEETLGARNGCLWTPLVRLSLKTAGLDCERSGRPRAHNRLRTVRTPSTAPPPVPWPAFDWATVRPRPTATERPYPTRRCSYHDVPLAITHTQYSPRSADDATPTRPRHDIRRQAFVVDFLKHDIYTPLRWGGAQIYFSTFQTLF